MNINGYKLKTELQNTNSGFSKWGFAEKNGKEYFIKELINPVYPIDKAVMSTELFEKKRALCNQYEAKFRNYYDRINKASHGNLVRINEFFRCGSRYYLITEKITGKSMNIEEIASLDEEKKLLLLKTVAHCFRDLHSAGIVHLDVKPSNILVKKTKNGKFTAKLIDFDSGFLKGEKLNTEELGGDLTHLAPETFLAIYGMDVLPDEKADIFGLGLIFHEYYCGKLPYYNKSEYEYPYEAALENDVIKPDTTMLPDSLAKLITAMLDADPAKRPSAEEIIAKLNNQNKENIFYDIKYVLIHFNGAYGKSISISQKAIKYRNTLHPEIADKTKNFPESYTRQKEKIITAEQFSNIICEISNAGLFEIIQPCKSSKLDSNAVCSKISVIFGNDTTYEYFTTGEPDVRFKNISELLSAYCDFPEIEKSWYGSEKKDWFTKAGDL